MIRKLAVLVILLLVLISHAAGAQEMTFGRFGKIELYGDAKHPDSVALFVSGDGGWNLGVVSMAQHLSQMNTLVIGIDIRHYLAKLAGGGEKCSYPAADFEALSKYVQRQVGIDNYIVPVLVGYSSGATLVYATLVQAPPGTFLGAVSMGFCPDLPVNKPFCSGYGLESSKRADNKGYDFLPSSSLKVSWIAFQGDIDKVCEPGAVATFTGKVHNAQLVTLPKVGHGFSVEKNWLPQFTKSYLALVGAKNAIKQPGNRPQVDAGSAVQSTSAKPAAVTSPAEAVDDLPLVKLSATGDNGIFAVILSGDGGWASIDRSLGESLVSEGISVVGFNSLQYFWKRKTPDESAQDLQRVISYYLSAWNKNKVVLIGYSQGADVLPFMVSRLPQNVQSHISGMALLGLGKEASFEITVSGWVGGSGDTGIPILPELKKLQEFKVLCVYGREEDNTLCPASPAPIPGWQAVELPGKHHFGNDYKAVADLIVNRLNLIENK